jgi:cobalt transporter subunit CbtA
VELFRKIVWVAGAAGALAGLLAMGLHAVVTVPLIVQAESYEKAADAAAHLSSAGDASSRTPVLPGSTEHTSPDTNGDQGLNRLMLTAAADLLTGFGFALLLVAGYVLRGRAVDWHSGLMWGLAGFVTFILAPGLGLPPEVPGTAAAPLQDRQVWWALTALATGSGLALVCFTRRAPWVLVGVVLLVLPHWVGAPHPAEFKSLAPEALAHRFVVATTVTSLVFWSALGAFSGFFYSRARMPDWRALLR